MREFHAMAHKLPNPKCQLSNLSFGSKSDDAA